MPSYAELVGSSLPRLINPNDLRGAKSDGEIACAKLKRPVAGPLVRPEAQRVVRGLDAWTTHVLEAVDAPLHGSGKNGAWTKADLLALGE